MRSLAVLVVVGLLLAGCVQTQTEDRQGGNVVRKIGGTVKTSIEVGSIVAEGASQTVLPGGIVRLVWEGQVSGPLRHEITIPSGALTMRARLNVTGTAGSVI